VAPFQQPLLPKSLIQVEEIDNLDRYAKLNTSETESDVLIKQVISD
jgi:hypothetical protein